MKSSHIKKNQSSKLFNKETEKTTKQRVNSKMPIITCTCGAKILLIPNLTAMDRAIKNHKAQHRSVNEEFLIAQILKSASEQVLH